MRTSIIVFICITLTTGCRLGNLPDKAAPPMMPYSGSIYTYQVESSDANGHALPISFETARIEDDTVHTSFFDIFWDTVGGRRTTSNDRWCFWDNGDLYHVSPGCDSSPLPITTHSSYDSPHGGAITTPIKVNGNVDSAAAISYHSEYEGMELVAAAGRTYNCTKVARSIIMKVFDPQTGGIGTTTTVTAIYWYSSDIRFFVKDKMNGVTRTLVSYAPGQ